MVERSEDLQRFVDAAFVAFDKFARDPEARRSIRQVFAALKPPGQEREGPGSRLPVCELLPAALSIQPSDPALRQLIDRFEDIEPKLAWRRKTTHV